MSLIDTWNAWSEKTTLKSQMVPAVVQVALSILGEDIATKNHDARVRWALRAAKVPKEVAEELSWSVAASSGISTDTEKAIDDDVVKAITNLVDLFAM